MSIIRFLFLLDCNDDQKAEGMPGYFMHLCRSQILFLSSKTLENVSNLEIWTR